MMQSLREFSKYALDALAAVGADAAECRVTKTVTHEFNAEQGQFNLLRTLNDYSLYMRAVTDGRSGSTHITALTGEAIDEAAAACVTAAESSLRDEAQGVSELEENAGFEVGTLTPDRDGLFSRLGEFVSTLGHDYPRVMLEQLISCHFLSDSLYANSNGVEHHYLRGGYTLDALFMGHDGNRAASFMSYNVRTADLERRFMDLGLFRTLFSEAERSLDTVSFPGKQVGKVVITPAALPYFLMAAAHLFLSDSALIEGTSVWKDALGTQVASPSLTLRAAPLDPRIVCGERFTEDGYVSRDADLIENGILQSFRLSRYGAAKTGLARALNLSSSFVVGPGSESLESIIGGIDRGLLINRFSGGEPAGGGDLSGVAKNSFLIENGRLGPAVSETMISGNLADMLKNIAAISSETVCDGTTCLPWICFDGVTISGK